MFPLSNWAGPANQARPSLAQLLHTRPSPVETATRPVPLFALPPTGGPRLSSPSSVSFFRVHHRQRAPIPNLSRFDPFVAPRARPTPYKYFPPPPRPIFHENLDLPCPRESSRSRRNSQNFTELRRLAGPLPSPSDHLRHHHHVRVAAPHLPVLSYEMEDHRSHRLVTVVHDRSYLAGATVRPNSTSVASWLTLSSSAARPHARAAAPRLTTRRPSLPSPALPESSPKPATMPSVSSSLVRFFLPLSL